MVKIPASLLSFIYILMLTIIVHISWAEGPTQKTVLCTYVPAFHLFKTTTTIVEEGAVVIVQPVTSLPKKPFRPIVYSRRNASRMTHLELAMKYAEERKAKLERERLQQVQLRQHTMSSNPILHDSMSYKKVIHTTVIKPTTLTINNPQ